MVAAGLAMFPVHRTYFIHDVSRSLKSSSIDLGYIYGVFFDCYPECRVGCEAVLLCGYQADCGRFGGSTYPLSVALDCGATALGGSVAVVWLLEPE